MQPAVTLRPATAGDEEHLFRVYAGTRTEELALVDWTDAQREAFLRMQFSAQAQYYREHYAGADFQVIESDGRPAGRLYVARWEDEIRLMDIAVLPAFRGRGIGTLLLGRLQEEARRSDKPLRIHVERMNPALTLYDRLGFRRVEDRGVYLFLEWRPRPNAEARA